MRAHPRRASKRDSNETVIVEALRKAGFLVSEGGWLCDLIVYDCNEDRTHYIEVKNARGRLTPTQEGAIEKGWPIRVVRSVEEAFEVVNG
jgi:hypothetical protein